MVAAATAFEKHSVAFSEHFVKHAESVSLHSLRQVWYFCLHAVLDVVEGELELDVENPSVTI